jgi:hypothetical protein
MEASGPEGPRWVRLLNEEPSETERYSHAAGLLAIVARQRELEAAAIAGAATASSQAEPGH